MRIGANRFEVVVHRQQDIGCAGEGRSQTFLDGLDTPALPQKTMTPPRPEIGKSQSFELAQTLDLAPEFGLGAGIENVEDKAALSFHHLARAQFVETGKRRNLPHRGMRPRPVEMQFVLAVDLAPLVSAPLDPAAPLYQ